MRWKIRFSSLNAVLLSGLATLIADIGSSFSQSATATLSVPLVRQDYSDCTNSNVRATKSALIDGEALVVRMSDGNTRVRVKFVKAKPNTNYHFFLKCSTLLGDVRTDASGRGENTFVFPTKSNELAFAFDSYPDDAMRGNTYQSIQVNFNSHGKRQVNGTACKATASSRQLIAAWHPAWIGQQRKWRCRQ